MRNRFFAPEVRERCFKVRHRFRGVGIQSAEQQFSSRNRRLAGMKTGAALFVFAEQRIWDLPESVMDRGPASQGEWRKK